MYPRTIQSWLRCVRPQTWLQGWATCPKVPPAIRDAHEKYFNYKKPPSLPFALKENYEESARIMERVAPMLGTGADGESSTLIRQGRRTFQSLEVTDGRSWDDYSSGLEPIVGIGSSSRPRSERLECTFLLFVLVLREYSEANNQNGQW